MSAMRKALQNGMHVITTNKGPLALAYGELAGIAKEKGVQLRHCGAVFGGLPAVSIAERDLAGATMLRLEAQANLANSFILDKMRHGVSYADAVQAAKDQGCADQDETLDVDGWDAVIKLVIFANSVLGLDVKIDDIERVSIRDISPEEVNRHMADGNILKYLAIAERQDDGTYYLSAKPVALPLSHGLGRLGRIADGGCLYDRFVWDNYRVDTGRVSITFSIHHATRFAHYLSKITRCFMTETAIHSIG